MRSFKLRVSILPKRLTAFAAVCWLGCSGNADRAPEPTPPPAQDAGYAGTESLAGAGSSAIAGSASGAPAVSGGGGASSGGMAGVAGIAGDGSAGTGTAGVSGAGVAAAGGAEPAGGAPSSGAGFAGAGGAMGIPSGCTLPQLVSFQKDVQPFLLPSCGGTGCHVVDGASTKSSGGYDHAYDWITATAHASSCPSGSPKRFEVVLAVIAGASPPSCSKSRQMPPPGASAQHAPLTACQVATLQAWLAEPFVTQMHRADDTSPTTPYPMPPFN